MDFQTNNQLQSVYQEEFIKDLNKLTSLDIFTSTNTLPISAIHTNGNITGFSISTVVYLFRDNDISKQMMVDSKIKQGNFIQFLKHKSPVIKLFIRKSSTSSLLISADTSGVVYLSSIDIGDDDKIFIGKSLCRRIRVTSKKSSATATALFMSDDDPTLIVGTSEGDLHFIDIGTNEIKSSISAFPTQVTNITIWKGVIIASSKSGDVYKVINNVDIEILVNRLPSPVETMCIYRENHLIIGQSNGTLSMIDLTVMNSELKNIVNLHSGSIVDICDDNEGNIYSLGLDGQIKKIIDFDQTETILASSNIGHICRISNKEYLCTFHLGQVKIHFKPLNNHLQKFNEKRKSFQVSFSKDFSQIRRTADIRSIEYCFRKFDYVKAVKLVLKKSLFNGISRIKRQFVVLGLYCFTELIGRGALESTFSALSTEEYCQLCLLFQYYVHLSHPHYLPVILHCIDVFLSTLLTKKKKVVTEHRGELLKNIHKLQETFFEIMKHNSKTVTPVLLSLKTM